MRRQPRAFFICSGEGFACSADFLARITKKTRLATDAELNRLDAHASREGSFSSVSVIANALRLRAADV